MQRKDIDQLQFDDLYSVMTDATVEAGDVITTVVGTHPVFGGLILISVPGACAVMGNDVHLIVGQGETIEGDLANAAAVASPASDPITPT